MIRFKSDFLEVFLAVFNKYRTIKGLSQKEVSEMVGVHESKLSRFLTFKTSNVDEQMVANIIAILDLPLREVIDGVEDESADSFISLVQFYKDQKLTEQRVSARDDVGRPGADAKTKTHATINIGGSRQKMPFGETMTGQVKTELTLRDKLEALSPSHKAFMSDFLNLNGNDRDLMVNMGNILLSVFKQRDVKF
jgi:transcriptional regulator with XRE-family HTH domain